MKKYWLWTVWHIKHFQNQSSLYEARAEGVSSVLCYACSYHPPQLGALESTLLDFVSNNGRDRPCGDYMSRHMVYAWLSTC